MLDELTLENHERIQVVERSFGPSVKSLSQEGRILVGEGQLVKQSRQRPQPKVFFLFNDMLVYGSIILHGRWYKKHCLSIISEDILLEDLEDGINMRNQWLIRTPHKSFYVAAASYEEKQTWIQHIQYCRSRLLQGHGHRLRPRSTFAVTWIPDKASATCMRCSNKFSVTQRRHHCRKCGFLVCGACSNKRAVIRHIQSTKWLRVCITCHLSLLHAETQNMTLQRGNSTGKSGSEDDMEGLREAEVVEEQMEDHIPRRWMDSDMDPWSPYVYFRPEHVKPQT
ncbi:pleckstrin homology domain-containing family F member 1 [Aulostomus maculatus]